MKEAEIKELIRLLTPCRIETIFPGSGGYAFVKIETKDTGTTLKLGILLGRLAKSEYH